MEKGVGGIEGGIWERRLRGGVGRGIWAGIGRKGGLEREKGMIGEGEREGGERKEGSREKGRVEE